MKNIFYECKNREELQKEIFDSSGEPRIPTHRIIVPKNILLDVFEGFTYFSPSSMNYERPANFILAREGNNPKDIIGVLNVNLFQSYNKLPDHWQLSFVEVREDKRQRGIATQLYTKLNEILTPGDFLVGTDSTSYGRVANLDEKRNKLVTVCPNFDRDYDFIEYCKEEGLMYGKNLSRN